MAKVCLPAPAGHPQQSHQVGGSRASPLRLLQHETGRLQPPQMPGRPMSAPALPEARPEHAGPPCACHHPQAASRAPPHLPRIPQLQPCTSPVGWDDRVACRPLPLPWPHSLSTSHGTMSFHSWNRVPRSSMTHTPGGHCCPGRTALTAPQTGLPSPSAFWKVLESLQTLNRTLLNLPGSLTPSPGFQSFL